MSQMKSGGRTCACEEGTQERASGAGVVSGVIIRIREITVLAALHARFPSLHFIAIRGEASSNWDGRGAVLRYDGKVDS